MADSNANQFPRSQQPSANARGGSEVHTQVADERRRSEQPSVNAQGSSGAHPQAANPSQPQNQLARATGGDRAADQQRGSGLLHLDPNDGLSGRVALNEQDEVESRYHRGRLVDMTDLNAQPARNFVRQQNNGTMPRTLVQLTRINRGSRNRGIISDRLDGPDNIRTGAQLPAPIQAAALQPLPAAPAAPATQEQRAKRRKKNRSQRKRARLQREELEHAAAHSQGPRHREEEEHEVKDEYQKDTRMMDPPERGAGDRGTRGNASSQPNFEFRAPPEGPSLHTCANCKRVEHVLSSCPGPVDQDGLIPGCVIHNSMDHTWDECPVATRLPLGLQVFNTLVANRSGLPAVRCAQWNWVDLAMAAEKTKLEVYPLTRAFSLAITGETLSAYLSGNAQLGPDPLTCSYDAMLLNWRRLRQTEYLYEAMQVEQEGEEF
ncbi:uncharacterized protein F4812DRAFT_457004 [Daldinia caldariorum]|uniref:uncharacterized protein n=1 Tax=Daldinia caldariorum TaxID=326644 RepID=UPI0020080F5A|nr:uncharacterized protein F4812DRAFT_457004 [Daldinia caldariorum]KAI1469604.1 hypothetical protein F4812DRAFT_457004 [Daldinia caldariorum]